MIEIRDNGDAFMKELEALSPREKVHPSVIGNRAPWAEILEKKDGYSVINEASWSERTDRIVGEAWADDTPMTDEILHELLEMATGEEVEFYHSFGDAYRPPVTAGGPHRPAHVPPLNWADITTTTAKSYYAQAGDREEKQFEYEGIRYK